eukprot:5663636-Lingulodinium_polyedra.AAC.1
MNDSGLGRLLGAIFRCSTCASTGCSLSLLDRLDLARLGMLRRPLPAFALLGYPAPHYAAERATCLTCALRSSGIVNCIVGLSGGAMCQEAVAPRLGSSLSVWPNVRGPWALARSL